MKSKEWANDEAHLCPVKYTKLGGLKGGMPLPLILIITLSGSCYYSFQPREYLG